MAGEGGGYDGHGSGGFDMLEDAHARMDPFGLLPPEASLPSISGIAPSDVSAHPTAASGSSPGVGEARGEIAEPWVETLTHTHWGTPREREAFIQQHFVHDARMATGREPDRDALVMTVGYYEDLAVKQEAVDRENAAEAATEKALEEEVAEAEKNERKADAIRMMGTDQRNYYVLNEHAAIGAPIYAAMPFVEVLVGLIPVLGQAVAVIEAATGESLFTGEELSGGERALSLLMVAIPEAGAILRSGARGAKAIVAIARQTNRDARAVLRTIRGIARASAEDAATMRNALAAAKTGGRLTAIERKAGQRLLQTLDREEAAAVRGKGYGDKAPTGEKRRPKRVVEQQGKPGGWNPELNNPQPNHVYEMKDTGYRYKTDEHGRVIDVDADLSLKEGHRNEYQQKVAGGEHRLEGDQGGHLVANIFHGPGEGINLVAMGFDTNNSAWKTLENSWAKALAEGKSVKVSFKVEYQGASLRPSAFRVEYRVGRSEPVVRRIPNA